jgi:hypothetical protein
MALSPSIALSILKTSANPRAAIINAMRRIELAAKGPKPVGFFGRIGMQADELAGLSAAELQRAQQSATDLLGRMPKGIPRNPNYVPGERPRLTLPQRISADLMDNTLPLAVGGGLIGLGVGAAID